MKKINTFIKLLIGGLHLFFLLNVNAQSSDNSKKQTQFIAPQKEGRSGNYVPNDPALMDPDQAKFLMGVMQTIAPKPIPNQPKCRNGQDDSNCQVNNPNKMSGSGTLK
jgi:hypothetical protein